MSTSSITNEDAGKTAAEVLLWLLQFVTAVLFFVTAYQKLTSSPMVVGMFEKIGFGQWFRYLTGGAGLSALIAWFRRDRVWRQ